MRKIIDDIIRLKKGGRIRVLNPMGGLEGAQGFFEGEGGRFPCYAGSRILYTDVDLDIYRCPALPERMGAVGDRIDFCRRDCDRCYYQGVRDFGPFYYLLETISSVGAGGMRAAFGRLDRRLLRALADANDIRTGGIA
jgi:MoaA/NifB/PqqE/SkfB family radical SAM enzyme